MTAITLGEKYDYSKPQYLMICDTLVWKYQIYVIRIVE